MSHLKTIKWQLLIMTGLGTVIFMYVAFIAFVWFYAQFMDPGHEPAFYSEFANLTGAPFMFCFAPFTMYIISRWLCARAGQAFYLHGLLYLVAYNLFDLSLIAFSGAFLAFFKWWMVLIYAGKLSGVMLGAHFACKAYTQMPATEEAIE